MKEIDLAYMAGILDGEGCIGIHRSGMKPNGNPRYFLRVSIGICNEYIPNLFKFHFGGRIDFYQPLKENWHPQWRWTVTCNKAAQCLNVLLPYLKLKEKEAMLGIQYQSEKKNHSGSQKGLNGGGVPETNEELALIESQRILMHNLKDKTEVINGQM